MLSYPEFVCEKQSNNSTNISLNETCVPVYLVRLVGRFKEKSERILKREKEIMVTTQKFKA